MNEESLAYDVLLLLAASTFHSKYLEFQTWKLRWAYFIKMIQNICNFTSLLVSDYQFSYLRSLILGI